MTTRESENGPNENTE